MTRNALSAGAVALAMAAGAPAAAQQNVTTSQLVEAGSDSTNWLMYSGAYDGQRYGTAREIDRRSAPRLTQVWRYDLQSTQPVETSPLVVDGVMYLTRPPNDVIALDAATGRELWVFQWPVPEDQMLCCGRINRGLAILGSTLYLTTIDAQLVALDAVTGTKKWSVTVADWQQGYFITSAPLVVKDMVLTGTSLDELSADPRGQGEVPMQRGRIDAYDAATGERRWRFYTVPVRGEAGSETWEDDSWNFGGASTWMTGSYDPHLDLVYWGVGAPAGLFASRRPGDNLYGSSVVALAADSGRLVWHFQFTPHDTHDRDAAQIMVLADVEIHGRQRAALLNANRNGFFYALDRRTGEFLFGRPFALQTWADSLDSRGRPVISRAIDWTPEGVTLAPTLDGATSWWSPAYSPRTGLFYVTAHDASETFRSFEMPPVAELATRAARLQAAAAFRRDVDRDNLVSAVRALDARTGDLRWEFRLPLRSTPGLLVTAGDLVFAGSTLGDFWALDALDGQMLWRASLDGWIHAAPVTYRASGRQFVTIATSQALYAFALDQATR